MGTRIIYLFLAISFGLGAQTSPVGRATAHLFYMPSLNSPILIDGYEKNDDSPDKSEVWQLKDGKWIRLTTGDFDARKLTAAAFDSYKNQVFTFAGIGKVGYEVKMSDGYVFDGRKWTKVDSNIGTRDHHEMVYANHLKAFVMYGGVNADRSYDTATWLFRNEKWERLDIAGPHERVHHAMAYDPVRKKVVLNGGGGNKKQYKDTWEFDGAKWVQIRNGELPEPQMRHSMTYDPWRKVILLYGGHELRAWDGVEWKVLSSDAPDRMFPAICYDTKQNKLIMFGGVDDLLRADTWEWNGTAWKKIIEGKTWKWNDREKKYVVQK